MKKATLLLAFAMFCTVTFGQTPDKNTGIFKSYEPGYFQNSILKGIDDFEAQKAVPKQSKTFKADPATFSIPASKDEFKSYWHNAPVSQGNTNTCWSFSTTSFFESEVFRSTGQKVRLSEIYTVYFDGQ